MAFAPFRVSITLAPTSCHTTYLLLSSVRRYVEGAKDSSKLLDLLAAVGQDDIEPTRAKTTRQALYPDVGVLHALMWPRLTSSTSTYL